MLCINYEMIPCLECYCLEHLVHSEWYDLEKVIETLVRGTMLEEVDLGGAPGVCPLAGACFTLF